MLRRLLHNEKGFTMVEMMVVMVIIAVLVAGGIKFYQGNIEKAKITKAKAQISTMQAALDIYYAENGKYPNGTDLGSEMLDAGLVLKAGEEGPDLKLEVTDPWGESYIYHSEGDKKFYISTGYKKIQDQGGGKAVYGNGVEGRSNPPTVGSPSVTSAT